MTQSAMKTTIIQHAPIFLNKNRSIEKAISLIELGARDGAEVIVFPETWLPGYPVWLDEAPEAAIWDNPSARKLYSILCENSITIGDKDYQKLQELATKYDIMIVLGVHELNGGTLYNTILYLHSDKVKSSIHRKLMPTYTEKLIWGMGDGTTLDAVKFKDTIIGGLICWEHWMPEARIAMHHQQEQIHIAQWPSLKELHQLCSRHYAFEGQTYVLAAGCVLRKGDILDGFRSLGINAPNVENLLNSIPGDENHILKNGGSCIIAPDSSFVREPVYETECSLSTDLDLRKIQEGKMLLDVAGHYSRPDVFKFEVKL